jgi:hypothetical protein
LSIVSFGVWLVMIVFHVASGSSAVQRFKKVGRTCSSSLMWHKRMEWTDQMRGRTEPELSAFLIVGWLRAYPVQVGDEIVEEGMNGVIFLFERFSST